MGEGDWVPSEPLRPHLHDGDNPWGKVKWCFLFYVYVNARHGERPPEGDQAVCLFSLLVSSTLRKKSWKFHEPVGQGGQGWLQVIQATSALAGVISVLWAFISPPVKWGGGGGVLCSVTAYSVRAFAPRGPGGRAGSWDTLSTKPWPLVGVSPSEWLLPGLRAAHLCFCGRLCPKHPSLLKPYSCGQIQGRGGDCPWDTGVAIEAAATWLTSFRLSCLLPPGLGRSECGDVWGPLRSPSLLSFHPSQPEQLKGTAFLHRQCWREQSQPFSLWCGPRIGSVRPAAAGTRGLS